jgi:hypothetical protein
VRERWEQVCPYARSDLSLLPSVRLRLRTGVRCDFALPRQWQYNLLLRVDSMPSASHAASGLIRSRRDRRHTHAPPSPPRCELPLDWSEQGAGSEPRVRVGCRASTDDPVACPASSRARSYTVYVYPGATRLAARSPRAVPRTRDPATLDTHDTYTNSNTYLARNSYRRRRVRHRRSMLLRWYRPCIVKRRTVNCRRTTTSL